MTAMSEGPEVADARPARERLELAARAAFAAFGHDVATPTPWAEVPEDFRVTFRMVADAVLMVADAGPPIHAAVARNGLWGPRCDPKLLWAVPLVQTDPYSVDDRDLVTCPACRAALSTDRCSLCRHARHSGPCLNMASDNDCSCPASPDTGSS